MFVKIKNSQSGEFFYMRFEIALYVLEQFFGVIYDCLCV